MSRRANAALRCARCQMHGSLCVCALIPTLDLRTRLLLVIHRCEARKPSNTGLLATECLTNHEVMIRGNESEPTAPYVVPPGTQSLFLFPREDAIPLTEFANSEKPITLIVPDGTWRQASKVRQRVPGFSDVPCVSLPADAPSVYRLRAEAHDHGLATMEAIARAFGILEGPPVRAALEHVFCAMVERTLWSRGGIATEDVTGGIPEGAKRHDPKSGLARSSGVNRDHIRGV